MAFALLDFGLGWDLSSLGIISWDNYFTFTVLLNQNVEGSIFRPHKTLFEILQESIYLACFNYQRQSSWCLFNQAKSGRPSPQPARTQNCAHCRPPGSCHSSPPMEEGLLSSGVNSLMLPQ